MPDWLSKERIDIIRSLGADIELISKAQGGFLGSIGRSEELHAQGAYFCPANSRTAAMPLAHANTTAKEIWHQLAAQGLQPDAFVAGVGIGGTVMGVGEYLKHKQPAVRIHPLEPAESPTPTTGYKGVATVYKVYPMNLYQPS